MAFISHSPRPALLAPLSLSLAGALGASAAPGGTPWPVALPATTEAIPATGAALAARTAATTPHTAAPDTATPHTAAPRRSARPAKPSGRISYDAKSISFDYPAQYAVLRGSVVVSQGDVRVTADRAEAKGLNPKNTNWSPLVDSRWTFTGNVHISSELQGNLESDTATIDWGDGLMLDAVVKGNPAQFEQTSSTTGVLARGHADSIVYTVAASTIRLTDDAWLKYGDNEISGPVLTYNIRTQQLQGAGAPDHGPRVHITVLPRTGPPKPSPPKPSRAKQGAAGAGAPQKGVTTGKQP